MEMHIDIICVNIALPRFVFFVLGFFFFFLPLCVVQREREREREREVLGEQSGVPAGKLGKSGVKTGWRWGQPHPIFFFRLHRTDRAAVFLVSILRQIPRYPPLPKKYCTNELDLAWMTHELLLKVLKFAVNSKLDMVIEGAVVQIFPNNRQSKSHFGLILVGDVWLSRGAVDLLP